jgi:hypothetical protein
VQPQLRTREFGFECSRVEGREDISRAPVAWI